MLCQASGADAAVLCHCRINSPLAPQLPTCCRSADGTIQDVTPGQDSGFNVRTRVHEYGGAPVVVGKEAIYFSNFKWAAWGACEACSAADCCAATLN